MRGHHALVLVALVACSCRGRFDDVDGGGGDGGDVDGGDWFDPAWSARQRITLALPTAAAIDDLPVALRLVPGPVDYASIAPDGRDLRFIDDTGTAMAFEIESFEATAGSIVWVKLPHLAPGVDPSFTMYFGNPAAPDLRAQASAVWSAGYQGVFHLSNALDDVTSNHNAATPMGTAIIPGPVGSARSFEYGAGEFVDINTIGFEIGSGARTECAWVSVTFGDAFVHYIVSYGAPGTRQSFFLSRQYDDLRCGGNTAEVNASSVFAPNRWYYACCTVGAGGMIKLLLDGVVVAQGTDTQWNVGAGPGHIGRAQLPGEVWSGAIDEVRISSVARSVDWIVAEYRAMNAAIVELGPIERR